MAATNNAPVLTTLLPHQSSAEDQSVNFVLPANAFTDVDGDALTLSATLLAGEALPDWLVFDAVAGSFSGMPPQNFNGTVYVVVRASDGSLSDSDAFALEITPVNDAPVAADDVAQSSTPITEDVVTLIDTATLLANDSDVDGDALTMISVSPISAHGAALSLSAHGTISYDPTGAADIRTLAEGETLTDTFTYTVDDGNGGESTATVSVEVLGVSDVQMIVVGTSSDDILNGGAGDDALFGLGGHDILYGGDGNDELWGDDHQGGASAGGDVLVGGAGDDELHGGGGGDSLIGGTGNDILNGQSGNDYLLGGRGDDILIGGTGDDNFIFGSSFGNDTITDFDDGIDLIQVAIAGVSYSDLAIISSGSDTEVSVSGHGTTITLSNFDATNLSEEDFFFL